MLGNFQCRGVLLIWMKVGQEPTALVVGAGGGCSNIFSLVYHFSFLSPALWETARYRQKYCFKGPLSPKQPIKQRMSKSRKENPPKLTQLSSRFHPRHLVEKRTARKDTIIDITSDSQVNSNFPYRWSPASLTFNNYFYLFL